MDAFDRWAVCKLLRLRIPYCHYMSNMEVRAVSGCPSPLSNVVTENYFRFFGHTTCNAPNEDRAVTEMISEPSSD